MRSRHLAPTVLAVALGFASACGGGDDEPAGASRQTIEIVATDFQFVPREIALEHPGIYTFRLVNEGDSEHALEIEGEGFEAETGAIAPGETADLKVELKPGRYELYCPVGNHADRGMTGTLTLGPQPAGGGTHTQHEPDASYGG